MAVIRGQQVLLREITRQDADVIARWPKFTEPDLQWANFDLRTPQEKDLWFRQEQGDFTRLRLAVARPGGAIIGLVSLRDIDYRRGSATLGIRLSAGQVGQGYGTDAISALLGYAFGALGLKRVNLDVAQHNARAQRCYEKCGFAVVGQHPGGDGSPYIDMSISKEEYLARFGPVSCAENPLTLGGR